MKKFLLSLTVGMLAAICSMAAPTTFTVDAPKWTKIVVSKNQEGVNVRKSPSTSAPKLVYNANSIDDYHCPLSYYSYWSSAPTRGTVYANTFIGPAPVYSENDGWVEIKNIGPKGQENGWISKSVVNIISPIPLKYQSSPDDNLLRWIPGGNESDGYYAIFFSYDEMEQTADFYIGRLENGLLVCPYALQCDYYLYPDQPFKITSNGSQFEINFNRSVMLDEYTPSIAKFTDAMIKEIISKAVKINPVAFYNYNGYLDRTEL